MFGIRSFVMCRIFTVIFTTNAIVMYGQGIDLTDRLLFHLPADGDASDQSGNNIPTAVYGAVLTEDRFGNPESAYLFDGINDRINLNNDQPVITEKTWTIAMWAKGNGESLAPNKTNTLFQQRDDDPAKATAQTTITFNTNVKGFFTVSIRSDSPSTGDTHVYRYPAFDYGEWHHYVSTLDEDKKVKVYLDGTLVESGQFPESGGFTGSVDHVDLGIHIYSNTIKGAFNGVIDDVYLYNRALNICEIKLLYHGTLPEER